jgi:lantibiotic transport system ATP-binding protein
MYILETRDLVHSFSETEVVLNGISLQVTEGSIYGFLGPNGAGKTTTLRLILGLIKKQVGSIAIFGKEFEKNRVETLRKIGSLIESPSVYSHLTAVENLTLLQRVYRCPRTRIGEVLELVGLAGTGNKKAGQFSLGMKQRLSIAIALLNNPTLLVLDEPTNGLDPNGIIEMRELLRGLNQQHGITIVISSHLLAEIDRLVSHIGIINKGRMVFQGTLDELKQKQQQSLSVVLETSDQEKTAKILRDNNIDAIYEDMKFSMPPVSRELIARINRQLVDSGVEVFEIGIVKNDLENIFIDLINN